MCIRDRTSDNGNGISQKSQSDFKEYDGKTTASVSYTHLDVYKRQYKLEIGKDPVGNMQRIHNTLSSIDRKLTESEQKLETCLLYTSLRNRGSCASYKIRRRDSDGDRRRRQRL